MRSHEVRRKFLDFFQEKKHTLVESASLVPVSDPTLLFTGAGMNQFKEYFLGAKRDLKRAASCQKCFRTGDVDEVGLTPSHLTFFEMLGNFSFGDYFKDEAIAFAWEFMTERLSVSPDKLWVSVYESDEEAKKIWRQKIGLPQERIIPFGAKENFWPSNAPANGPNGPCGPCSEIYYDYERCLLGKPCPDPDHCAPGCPCGRFVEVWNLVFTQFDRQEGGGLLPLPAKNIDTGMGLERMSAVMQGKMSVFETDLFEPTIEALIHLLRQEVPELLKVDQRAGVYAIADHARALTFLIGDGVVPSNEGRGYVLRMLLRKAERAGISLGLAKPFLYRLVPSVTKIMGPAYPQLTSARESIAKAILTEEERFHQNMKEKMPLLEEEVRTVKEGKGAFPAELAARFYDTHGLAYEEILGVCRKEKVPPPSKEEFDRALAALQAASKAKSAFSGEIFSRDELKSLIHRAVLSTPFIGYADLEAKVKVVGLMEGGHLAEEVRAPARVGILLDRSPFYGESGGQVGDQGILEGPEGKARVVDTKWIGDVLLHQAEVLEGRLKLGDPSCVAVDPARRREIAANHTVTHLLHAALRKVLGSHVTQAGSLVAPDRIRFDFSHPSAVSRTQLTSAESLVNEWVYADLPVLVHEMPLEKARAQGALALFGEKYASKVRVVSIGEISKELCGGTHLSSSVQAGLVTLAEEGSVASGVRRVEALTGKGALSYLKSKSEKLEEVAQLLTASPKQVSEALGRLMKQMKSMEEELKRLKVGDAQAQAKGLKPQMIGTVTFFPHLIQGELDHGALRSISDALRKSDPNAVTFLSDSRGFCVATSGGTVLQQGISADDILKQATEIAGGSGGGRPELAQGRIGNLSNFAQALERIKRFIQEKVKG